MRSDDYLDDDVDERDRRSATAIFASGWFRAVLVLGVLAITLAVAVPYVLRWMDPGPAKIERQVARPPDMRPTDARPTVAPTTPAPSTALVPAPVTPAVSAPAASAPMPSSSMTTPSATTPSTAAPSGPTPGASTPAQTRPPSATAPSPGAPVAPASPPKMAAPPVGDRLVPTPAPAPAAAERAPAPARPAAVDDARKVEPTPRTATHPEAAPAKVGAAPAARTGDFWVQVGAFRSERNAEGLVRTIRERTKMPAQMTRRARAETVAAVAPRHEVFVADAQVGAVNAALRGHGSAQAVRGGVAVQPPLELKEAVALSRRLSGEGMSVKIRRVGGDTAAAEPATTYVVRVGGYASRAQAEAAQRELARKGINGFIADTPAR